MKNKFLQILAVASCAFLLAGCGAGSAQNTEAPKEAEETVKECPLEDGVYIADFETDSSMFCVNDTCDGKGVLTVENGEMTIHVTLLSQKILNLYSGLAEDAAKDGAQLIEPTLDTVTYDDGISEEVFGFDIPVPALDEEFDVALIGTKGTWYDHKVSVKNAVPESEYVTEEPEEEETAPEEGVKLVNVTFSGGSGKAYIESPATCEEIDGVTYVTLTWSSKNYDYMLYEGEKYLNQAAEGEPSVFVIPIDKFGEELTVIGDTVAMSTPHEIEYTILLEIAE